MARSGGSGVYRRKELPSIGGVSTLTSWNVSQITDLSHCENATGPVIGSAERRQGYSLLGNATGATANSGFFYFPSSNASSSGLYRVSTIGGVTCPFYLNSNQSSWVSIGAFGQYMGSAPICSTVNAESRMYIVNGQDSNRFIHSDGVTVTLATDPYSGNDFFNAPRGRKVNYFKGRLYLADLYVGGVRYQNQVQMSSPLLGIVSLVDGDFAAGSTTINVTDTKYIYSADSLEVYRGDNYIATLAVSNKTETTITVAATGVALQSSDELWVEGTRSGERRFRWAGNNTVGMPVKRFDTFYLAGGDNQNITMMTNVGSYMMIGNHTTLATWDGTNLSVDNSGIGCVSDKGWVKFGGLLNFIHYTGIYSTSGGAPKMISSRVDRYFRGATKSGLENAVAGRKGFSLFFYIGDITIDNPDGSTFETLTDVVLEYDQRMDDWYVATGIPVDFFTTFVDSVGDPDQLVFISNADTRKEVFKLDSGETDDDGSAFSVEIPFRIDTQDFQLCSSMENVAYMSKLVVYADRGNTIHCFVSLDGGDFYELRGQFDKGVGVIPIVSKDSSDTSPPRCRRIKVSLRATGLARPRVSKMAITYWETPEEEENPR